MPNKPNILLVFLDSLRADRASCYSYHRKTTPNLDRLAAEGCRFTSAITAAPFSPASYASLMSNLYPHQHGVNGDTIRIWPDQWHRLPELLRPEGYFTFCVSNNSFVTREMNTARGFDAFCDIHQPSWFQHQQERVIGNLRRRFGDRTANRFMTNALKCRVKGDSAQSVEQILQLADGTDQPFFGFVILMDPHTPYRKDRLEYAGNTPAVRRFFRQRNNRTMWADLMAHGESLSDEEREVVRDLYDAETRHADACLGRLIDELSQRGTLDDTIIAVASDHGEAFGEHGVWGHGFCLNDCLTRVPLVVRHPTYWPAGTQCDALVQLHDLHELCMSVSHNGTPRLADCPHCLTQAANPEWTGREFVFSEFPRQSKTLSFMANRNPRFVAGRWDHDMWAVRTARWRYLEWGDKTNALYDLHADPEETTPVEGHTETRNKLAAALEAHRNDQPCGELSQLAPQRIDENIAERLRALGYIE